MIEQLVKGSVYRWYASSNLWIESEIFKGIFHGI